MNGTSRTNEPTLSSIIFLGTGTSSQVPAIGCLTDPHTPCTVCPSALLAPTQKNRRRNTSALLTLSNKKTILIDCGKSFFDAAIQIWPRARLRQIDAVFLTHAHADAMNGLDDLRGWTLGGFVQKGIDVYCSLRTYESVGRTFPYMIDASAATGGGDIPDFRWHVIDEEGEFWVEGCGVHVRALPVEHGMTFGEAPAPFVCLGFKVGDRLAYISDASKIPTATREEVQGVRVAVLDALKRGRHASHMSIPETLEFVNGLERPPGRTLLLDFTHDVDHYAFEDELKATQKLDIRPAYDGLQLVFGEDGGIKEVDLLRDRELIAVCDQDGGHDRRTGKAGGMV